MTYTNLYKLCSENRFFDSNKRASIHLIGELTGCDTRSFFQTTQGGFRKEVTTLGNDFPTAQVYCAENNSRQYLSIVLHGESSLNGKVQERLEIEGFTTEKPPEGHYLSQMILFDKIIPK